MGNDLILVLDLETTGFSLLDHILEIGMVELNTTSGDMTLVYDKLILPVEITEDEITESWFYKNSGVKLADILKAKPFDAKEVQRVIDSYPLVAAYNYPFDNRFLVQEGVQVVEWLRDPMMLLKEFGAWRSDNGRIKAPSMDEAYRWTFNIPSYEEAHRAGLDALDEAKIIFELYEQGYY